jgi:hypothetical protein
MPAKPHCKDASLSSACDKYKTSILSKYLRPITPQILAVMCYLAGFPHVPGIGM